jgi:hypothetical protein
VADELLGGNTHSKSAVWPRTTFLTNPHTDEPRKLKLGLVLLAATGGLTQKG